MALFKNKQIIADLEARLAESEAKRGKAIDEHRIDHQRNEELNKTLAETKKDHGDTVDRLAESALQATKAKNAAEAEAAEARAVIAQRDNQLKAANLENANLTKRLNTAVTDFKNKSTDFTAAQAQIRVLESKLTKAEKSSAKTPSAVATTKLAKVDAVIARYKPTNPVVKALNEALGK